MPLNPAIADAYRKVVVTTGTGSGGVPGTATAAAVDAELTLDAGFGISLVTDVLNNKVTIVNTGNGTGALTTITENNVNGTFYPIFSRSPPGTQTFTTGASDFVSGSIVSGVAEVRVTGTTNDVYGVSANLRAALLGIIPAETFSIVRVFNGTTLNFTATAAATYDSINGYWVIPVDTAPVVTDTFASITIATGAGELNPITGTYQMDTMYLDTTTTPLSYTPSVGTLNVTNIAISGTLAVTGHLTVEGVTSTGATGTGNIVFATSPSVSDPTITGHATIEGQTLTGVTGTGKLVLDNDPTITGHATIEGQTLTGVTGTGKLVLDNAPTITGHPTVEGVTSTGATGTGKFVFDTAPAITGITTLGIRDTTAAFDVTLAATSTSATLTANRTVTLDVGDAARTVKLNGNLNLGGNFTIDNNVTIAGPYEITITPSGVFNATFPAGTYDLPKNDQQFYVGTTALTINRSSAAQSLTGITSIDGYAAGLAGGNGTTLLGSLPYQSAANTTSLLSPNTTTTRKFVRMTGDGTNGTAPVWDTVTATDVGLGNVTDESKATMFTDPTFTGTVSLAPATFESVSVSATAATGTVNVSVKTNTVFYYTTDASANWTFNFRGDGSTALNDYLTTGKSVTAAFLVTQGVTAYYPSSFTVDSNASGVGGYVYSIKWLGGSAPSGGNASSIDSYSFTIIKTADKAFTILASAARFG